MNLFTIFVSSLVSVYLAAAIPINSENKSAPSNLQYVGTVDGKSFFREESINRNWFDGFQLCSKNNMDLASITTHGEKDMLGKNLGSQDWCISGRDSDEYRDFTDIGNDNGLEQYPLMNPIIGNYVATYGGCVYARKIENGSLYIGFDECTIPSGILCEITNKASIKNTV